MQVYVFCFFYKLLYITYIFYISSRHELLVKLLLLTWTPLDHKVGLRQKSASSHMATPQRCRHTAALAAHINATTSKWCHVAPGNVPARLHLLPHKSQATWRHS